MAAGDPSSEHGVAVVERFREETGVPLGALLDEESVAAGHGGLLARLSRRGCQFPLPGRPGHAAPRESGRHRGRCAGGRPNRCPPRRAHIVRRVARARANGEVPAHLARGDITVILNGRRVGR
jgi:hypothetical protein